MENTNQAKKKAFLTGITGQDGSYLAEFMYYFNWLKDHKNVKHHYHLPHLLNSDIGKLAELQNGQFEVCFLFISISHFKKIKPWLATIKKMLAPNGKIVILIPNEKNEYSQLVYDFPAKFTHNISSILNLEYDIKGITSVRNNMTLLGAIAINKINQQ